jgi:hypothetical protein
MAKEKKRPLSREGEIKNYRCRSCLIVDGYTKEEKKCRHCGGRIFEIDLV